MLARRDYSCHELARKLVSKGFDSDAVTLHIEALQTENLISDTRYALSNIRVRAGKGDGPLKIEQHLLQAGVTQQTIKSAFAELAIDWLNYTEKAWNKRFRGQLALSPHEIMKQKRFLQQRGFLLDDINQLMRLKSAVHE